MPGRCDLHPDRRQPRGAARDADAGTSNSLGYGYPIRSPGAGRLCRTCHYSRQVDYPVTIKDDDTGLLSMAVTSTPSLMATGSTDADLYGADNMIEFTATFNNKVTVSGTPEFEFVLGTTNKRATYVRGSDSTELVFSYTVVTADTDSDGISWAANKIVKVSSATIREMGETTDAVITHALQGALSGHKVDGSQAGVDRPAVSIAAVHDDGGALYRPSGVPGDHRGGADRGGDGEPHHHAARGHDLHRRHADHRDPGERDLGDREVREHLYRHHGRHADGDGGGGDGLYAGGVAGQRGECKYGGAGQGRPAGF